MQATYEEAKTKCSRLGLMLAAFESQDEWISLKEKSQNATGKFLRLFWDVPGLCLEIYVDRLSIPHFIDMKKNGSLYFASDGSSSKLFENILQGEGECVVYKNWTLLAAPCNQLAYFVCENK
jgi:hypothetical protein